MIVVTDGESHDGEELPDALKECEDRNITRYAIAVSPSDKRNIQMQLMSKERRWHFPYRPYLGSIALHMHSSTLTFLKHYVKKGHSDHLHPQAAVKPLPRLPK